MAALRAIGWPAAGEPEAGVALAAQRAGAGGGTPHRLLVVAATETTRFPPVPAGVAAAALPAQERRGVGDWVLLGADRAVPPRRSLSARAAGEHYQQPIAANVDVVLVVTGWTAT